MTSLQRAAVDALLLANSIKPMLVGKGPLVQGGALVELVSMFIAGHAPDVREEVLAEFLDAVNELIPINSPAQWKPQPDGEGGLP